MVYSVSAFLSLWLAVGADALRGKALSGARGNIARDAPSNAVKRRFAGLRFLYEAPPVKKANLYFAFLSFLPLYIVSAIRYKVGTDYAGAYRTLYEYVYRGVHRFRFSLTGDEELYYLLNWIAKFYSGKDYTGVFALSSLLVCAFVCLGLRDQSKRFCYGVALFILSGFYYWSFNVVRQSIAMAIFIYALQFLRERKPVPYMICVVVAMGFHSIALLYIPLYFINAFRIDLKLIAAYSIIYAAFSAYFLKLAFFLTHAIPMLHRFAGRYFLDSETANERWSSSVSHLFINLSFFLLFTYIAWVYDRKRERSNLWINFQGCALMVSMMGNIIPVASRLSRLFEVVWMISIPCMTELIRDRATRRFINALLVVCLLAYLFLTYFVLGYHEIIPYRTIFNRS